MSDLHNPVDAIRHDNETRVAIPTQELAGTEAQPKTEKAEYEAFRHEFNRGRDPEIYWLGKYNNDSEETRNPQLQIDIRSLYVHEDIHPEEIINSLYKINLEDKDNQPNLFEHIEVRTTIEQDYERIADYYTHSDRWKNRLIQGDSLLVMNSLLQRENMAGKVQCIYIDPPYGIKYGSNWQMKLNSRDVKDNDENLSGQPEMIKAFRDTWELGIHSYLSYLRDRLVLARELLTTSGSVFVQISDDNVHLVRSLLDEVFGSENFVSQIIYKKTAGFETNTIGNVADYIVWYAKNIDSIKVRKIFTNKISDDEIRHYNMIELSDGSRFTISEWEKKNDTKFVYSQRPKGSKIFSLTATTSSGLSSYPQPYSFEGRIFYPAPNNHWKAKYPEGLDRLAQLNRLVATSDKVLRYVRYADDFEAIEQNNIWDDTGGSQNMSYVVQTSTKVIQRCILMTTDPGDLVLDPTCGSGTTAYVAEQWGRRWITIDTSRIALNIAKKRLATAVYPYYELFDKENGDIRQGFIYKRVPHITLKSLANNEPAAEEILYDQPQEDKKRMRVSGPFTVETLQNHNVLAPESLEQHNAEADENRAFQERIFSHLQSSGIINGDKSQRATFHSLEPVANPYLNARGWYKDTDTMNEIEKIRELTEQLKNENIKSTSEVAFFIDLESNYYVSGDSDYPMFQFQAEELNRMGMPWDCYLTSDLFNAKFDDDKYKLYIFPNLFKADEKIINRINVLRKKGKSMLFMHAPGYISDGGFNEKMMESVTGIKLGKCKYESAKMTLDIPDIPYKQLDFSHKINAWREKDPNKKRVKFNMPPVFEITGECERFGIINESGGVGLGLKEREQGGFDAFCACAPVPCEILHMLCLRAGIFEYCKSGTVMYGNSKMLTVYSYEGGNVRIKTPKEAVLTEYFSGEKYKSDPVSGADVHFRPIETKIFIIL